MADWKVTATTIYCDAVDDDVTIMVSGDWSARCLGYRKYAENLGKEEGKNPREKAKKLGRNLGCEGPLDYRVTEYRDRLMAEDEAASS